MGDYVSLDDMSCIYPTTVRHQFLILDLGGPKGRRLVHREAVTKEMVLADFTFKLEAPSVDFPENMSVLHLCLCHACFRTWLSACAWPIPDLMHSDVLLAI